MKNRQTHAALLCLVGGYVLYMAWHLYENLQNGTGGMSATAAWIAIAAFVLGGIGVLFYALKVLRTKTDEDSGGDGHDERKS